MAASTKTFQSDDSVLDPAIKSHIASLYAAVDNKDLEVWGAHFTEDAELKKGASNVRGRESKMIIARELTQLRNEVPNVDFSQTLLLSLPNPGPTCRAAITLCTRSFRLDQKRRR